MMAKVKVSEGAEAAAFPIGGYAAVRVVLRETEYGTRVDVPRGDPSRPPGWDELAAKFRDCAVGVLSAEAAEHAVAMVEGLDRLADVTGLTETLSAV